MHYIDFLQFVQRAKRNQSVMASVLLNTLSDPKEFPVDISDLRKLTDENWAIVNSLLDWSIAFPGKRLSKDGVEWARSFIVPTA